MLWCNPNKIRCTLTPRVPDFHSWSLGLIQNTDVGSPFGADGPLRGGTGQCFSGGCSVATGGGGILISHSGGKAQDDPRLYG